MLTKDFIKEMSQKVEGGNQTNTKPYFEAFLEVVKETLAKGENISLQGFLGLEVINVPSTPRKNPQTGISFMAEPTRKIKITQGVGLKNCVK